MSNKIFSSNSSFDYMDYFEAKNIYSAWHNEQSQDIEDYIFRHRKAELNALVKRVIENELTSSERLITDLRWNQNYSGEEIAAQLGIDHSTVYRRLEKITDKLYDKLKYALEYRFGKRNEAAAVLVKMQIPLAAKIYDNSTVIQRLQSLRKQSELTVNLLSEKTKIPKSRIEEIENEKEKITLDEVIIFSEFYKVSTDYILFGKQRILRDPLTGMPMNCNC